MAFRKRDFTHVEHFPGTHGNRFDRLLSLADAIQGLPWPVFAGLLLALAALAALAHGSWLAGLLLWLFLLGDWALLAALPRLNWSYGPPRPPALMLAVMRLPPALLPLPWALATQALGTVLVIYGFWIEPHRLGLTRQRLVSPKLQAGRSLRVLHLGDLHAEIGVTPRERGLIALVRAAQPDLILFSGDFLNLSYLDDRRAWEAARSVLRELWAPLGVLAVSGSPAVDRPELVPQVLDGLPHVRWLRDEVVGLDHAGQQLNVVGLTCTHKPFVDGPRLAEVLSEAHRPGHNGARPFTILLYHTPDLAPEAAEAGIDLQLSGHTHGGQVRLPWYGALFSGSLYGKRYEAGRIVEGAMTLYVTRGIGMEGKGAPRVRFLAPPEITLWDLSGSPEQPGASQGQETPGRLP
jgi:predicted MPP superfamily phosphohydrolase